MAIKSEGKVWELLKQIKLHYIKFPLAVLESKIVFNFAQGIYTLK